MNDEKVIVIDTDGCEEPTKITKELISEVCERLSKVNEDLQESMQKFLEDVKDIDLSAIDPEDRQFILNTRETLEKIKNGKANNFDNTQWQLRPPLPDVKTYGLMNDKANNVMLKNSPSLSQDSNGQLSLCWAVNEGKTGKSEVPTYIAMTYEGTDRKISRKMNAFDYAVYNAISTRLYYWSLENHNTAMIISPQEIWRTMNGQNKSCSPSASQTARVCKSIDKMRFTRFYMDISHELKQGFFQIDNERLVNGSIETYLLKADKVRFSTEKGRTVEGYKISEEPILYTYNRAKNHILWFDYSLLDTSDTTGNVENTLEFKNYLIMQILRMKNFSRDNEKIKFSTIYECTGIEPPEVRIKRERYSSENSYKTKIKQESQKDRNKIFAILDSWISKGFIKGYEPIKEKRSFVGVQIDTGRKSLPQKKTDRAKNRYQ